MNRETKALLGIQLSLISVWVLVFSLPSESERGLWASIFLLLIGTGLITIAAINWNKSG